MVTLEVFHLATTLVQQAGPDTDCKSGEPATS